MASGSKPLAYTTEIGLVICDRLVEGEILRAICAEPGMPDLDTVRHWLAQHEDFRKSYESTQSLLADFLQDEILEIADDSAGDWVEKVRASGRVVTVRDRKHLARCRLRVEVRSWVLDQRLRKNATT
jgi:Bacteriophage Sf6, terminase small subunit-like